MSTHSLMCFNCPVSGFFWEEFGSLFSFPSSPVFIHVDKIPLSFLFCRVKSNSPLCLWKRCSSHLNFFVALCVTFPSKFMSFLHWVSQTCSQHVRCWTRKKQISLAQETAGSLYREGVFLSHGQLAAHNHLGPSVLSCLLGNQFHQFYLNGNKTCSCFRHSFQVFFVSKCVEGEAGSIFPQCRY